MVGENRFQSSQEEQQSHQYQRDDQDESFRRDERIEIDFISIFNMHTQLLNIEELHEHGTINSGWPPPTRYVRRPRPISESAPFGPKPASLDPDLRNAGPTLFDLEGLMFLLDR